MWKLNQSRVFSNLLIRYRRKYSNIHCLHCYPRQNPSAMSTISIKFGNFGIHSLSLHTTSAVNVKHKKQVDMLSAIGIESNNMDEKYNWLNNYNKDILQEKYKLINDMGFEEVEHTLPFYRLSQRTLLSIWKTVKSDKKEHKCQNRLYYISNKLQCDPAVLSEYLSKRSFVYKLSFDWLKDSLNVLLEMGVPPRRILKDLWVLRYHHETIRERLEHVKAAGRDDVTTWMVRCSTDILQRSIEISQITKNILGENDCVQSYLAERLKTTPEIMSTMCLKIPAVQTVRVAKAKSCLDFLFSVGYTEEDVIKVPRILAHSLATTRARQRKLQEAGIEVNRNLNILCKSKKDFERFYKAAIKKSDNNEEDSNSEQKQIGFDVGIASKQ